MKRNNVLMFSRHSRTMYTAVSGRISPVLNRSFKKNSVFVPFIVIYPFKFNKNFTIMGKLCR
jgi:hypothetical protein